METTKTKPAAKATPIESLERKLRNLGLPQLQDTFRRGEMTCYSHSEDHGLLVIAMTYAYEVKEKGVMVQKTAHNLYVLHVRNDQWVERRNRTMPAPIKTTVVTDLNRILIDGEPWILS